MTAPAESVVLERLLGLAYGIGVWVVALGSILLTLSWLVRRNFWYGARMRDFRDERVPAGAVIVIGTSTIRLWDTLARDLAPWPALNRGFGGAVVSQCVHYASSLVPDSGAPAALVFYAGANDLAWFVRSSSVFKDTERFIEIAQSRAPGAKFYLVSICKSPARFLSWRSVDALNLRLRELADRKGVRFVDVASEMLAPNGRPRRDLFSDGLHPSEKGYAIWSSVLRRSLEADLGSPGSGKA